MLVHLTTPVRQSLSPTIAVITVRRGRNIIFSGGKHRAKDELEVPMLSLAQAEEFLRESESGSVLLFVHCEPQPLQSKYGVSSSSQKIHHLYISFKYRTSMIHFEYFWVHLKSMRREARRSVFEVEQKYFDVVNDLNSNFIPIMKEWLSAIVKAANFVDQPVQSVNLKNILQRRHHVILIRNTSKVAQVVLCKLDPDTKQIRSKSIDFDFKNRTVRDDTSNELRSFHEIFQQFLCLHHANTLMPSPREEDEEEPVAVAGFLEGLHDESTCPKTKLKHLLHLQSHIRNERSSQQDGGADPQNLELWTSLLLPLLMQSSKSAAGNSASSGVVTSQAVTSSNSSTVSPSSDSAADVPFNEIQVLVSDMLAELCDMNVESVAPHIWRMCEGYLEDPTNWHACLAALGLLTFLSKRLAGWLVKCTNASMRIFWVVAEAHQLLGCQKAAALTANGKVLPPKLGQLRSTEASSNSTINNGSRRVAQDQNGHGGASVAAVDRDQSRRGVCPAPVLHSHNATTSSRWGDPVLHRDRDRLATASRGDWRESRVGGPSWSSAMHRVPSFDNFDDVGATLGSHADDCLQPANSPIRSGTNSEDCTPIGARRLSDNESSFGTGASSNDFVGDRQAKPMRVPPLQLSLVNTTTRSRALSNTRNSRREQLGTPTDARLNHSAFGITSKSPPSGRLANAHTASAPHIGLRSMLGGFGSTPITPPQRTATTRVSFLDKQQCYKDASELAKKLGEAFLLSGLSHILKHKQDLVVQEAVMEKERQTNLSPRSRLQNGPVRSSSSASLAGPHTESPSPKILTTSESASSLRAAARVSLPGAVPAPILPGSASSSYSAPAGGSISVQPGSGGSLSVAPGPSAPSSSNLAPADLRTARLTAFRRVRLYGSLVLQHFCACAQDPAKVLGPHVPVTKLFEMLQSSQSRHGACSFTFEDYSDSYICTTNNNQCVASSGPGFRQVRDLLHGPLVQRLCPWRLERIQFLYDRLQQSASARKCVCGASSVSRSGSPEDLCTCVDDALASCIWQFLRAHALHVEKLEIVNVPAPNFQPHEAGSDLFVDWVQQPNAWSIRLGLDSFLVRIQRALVQTLMQLRSAHSAATAGPDLIATFQHRLAFLLRLSSLYTRNCSGRVLPLQVFQTINTGLLAVKGYLCSNTELLSIASLSLWLAYLQLIGTLLRGVRNLGSQRAALGEVFFADFLDFASSLASSSQMHTPPVASAGAPPPPPITNSAPLPRTGASSPVPPRVAGQAPRNFGRSASLRTLNATAGVPPRLPTSTISGSPRSAMTAERPPSMKVQTTRESPRSICDLIPQIIETVLFDEGSDGSTAAKSKIFTCEETRDTARCQVLGFVESLLDFAHSLACAKAGNSSAVGPDALDVSGDGKRERDERSQQLSASVGIVFLGAQEPLRTEMTAASGPLLENLLDWMRFLFLPPSGLLCKLGHRLDRYPAVNYTLLTRLVLCERALFRVPAVAQTVYGSETKIADYYIRRHFLSFVRLYNSPREDLVDVHKNDQLTRLCCLHLQTLLAIASLRTDLTRRAFQQLSVLDFLAGEIDLEHDTKQMHRTFLGNQQKNLSRVSAATNSTPGSCASSPNHELLGLSLAHHPLGSGRLGSGRLRAGAPPPVTSSASQASLGLPVVASWQTTPSIEHLPLPQVSNPSGNPDGLDSSDDSSDDDAKEAAPPAPEGSTQASQIRAPAMIPPIPGGKKAVPKLSFNGVRPSLQGTGGLGAPPPEEPGIEPQMPEPIQAPPVPQQIPQAQQPLQRTLPPPVPSLGGAKAKAVPKLSFFGLRPSLQGSNALGAPPPEEPGQPQLPVMMQAMANQQMEAPLEPPSPARSDSDSSSDAPSPVHMPPQAFTPTTMMSTEAPASTTTTMASTTTPEASLPVGNIPPVANEMVNNEESVLDSSDEELQASLAVGNTHPIANGTVATEESFAVYEDPREPLDSSDEELQEELGRPLSIPALAPPQAASHDVDSTSSGPALPPMPQLHHSAPLLGSYQLPATTPGLSAPAMLGTRQRSIPKLSFQGVRTSLQGTAALGAVPPEEPVALGSVAPPPGEPSGTGPMPMQVEPAQITPTGSGHHTPKSGSAASVPTGNIAAELSMHGVVHENIFYFEAREQRRIYEDPELHSLILTLILALLLTPKRGLLDSTYVEQYPTANRKRNVPFLFSFHINHCANRNILPWLSQQVEAISHIGGLRLLKLLCETAMHRWMYSNKTIIGSGQFGHVSRAEVQFSDQNVVAVKQIAKQKHIQDRCVFADVFSEIACLDAIRFENNVCQLFDYGVDEGGYWIVMKYYQNTLKKWREALVGTVDDNLPVLLAVYRQVLKAVHVLHRHGVVHYDLKCDNIMIDPDRIWDGDGIQISEACNLDENHVPANRRPSTGVDDQIPRIAVADFGESRMMLDENDVCTRNRGTEVLKCPEMLQIDKVARQEGDYYDRRKIPGTNQAADVWSVGCLLFELLTGSFLFQDPAESFVRVTNEGYDILTQEACRLLEGNIPLIEFIRKTLQRNSAARHPISQLIKNFDVAAAEALRFTSRHSEMEISSLCGRRESSVSGDTPRSVARSTGASSGGGRRVDLPRPERPLICAALGETQSYFTKVFRDFCVLEISNEDCLLMADGISDVRVDGGPSDAALSGNRSCAAGTLKPLLSQYPWTHIVDFRVTTAPRLPCQLEAHYLLRLPWSSPSRSAEDFLTFLPTIFDFLRHAAITRGVVLLVDGYSTEDWSGGDATSSPTKTSLGNQEALGGLRATAAAAPVAGRHGFAMASVLALVVETYQMAVFPALSHLSSQLLITALRPDVVCALARWQESERSCAWRQCQSAVRVSCLCGSCSWHIPHAWLAKSNGTSPGVMTCTCSPQSPDSSHCPNRGHCQSYLRWLRARFGIEASSMRFLWLPRGEAESFGDNDSSGSLTRGIPTQAEPVADNGHYLEERHVRVRRFRCRSCQVLTHAEVCTAESDYIALVTTYEKLRWKSFDNLHGLHQATSISDDFCTPCPPPACFRDTRMEEVVLPRTSFGQREGACYL